MESTIIELGGICQQLANKIQHQEEVLLRLEEAALNLETGQGEILRRVTYNRWLLIKIGVLIFFFIFFIVFMA
jgi:hypothetical protein